jgi:hypothetical protein
MITESDIKALRTAASKLYRVTLLTVGSFIMVVMLVCAVGNFLLCARFAEGDGSSMRDIWNIFFHGIDVSKQYSGTFLKALDRFSSALLDLLVFIWSAACIATGWKRHKRSVRILGFLEEKLTSTTR